MHEIPTGLDSCGMKAIALRRPFNLETLYRRCCAILSDRRLKVLKWAVILTSPVLTISAVLFAPRYLAYADPPRQADAVILFLGQPYEARKQEALQLIREEYARVLIIPDRNRVYVAQVAGSLKGSDEVPDAQGTPAAYARHLEATHREVLEAKRIMDERDLRTAILVSSPHHMRRIKLIAERVFVHNPPFAKGAAQSTYRLHFVPTRYETVPGRLWFINGPEVQRVISEYVKIAWFRLYRCFAPDPAHADSEALELTPSFQRDCVAMSLRRSEATEAISDALEKVEIAALTSVAPKKQLKSIEQNPALSPFCKGGG